MQTYNFCLDNFIVADCKCRCTDSTLIHCLSPACTRHITAAIQCGLVNNVCHMLQGFIEGKYEPINEGDAISGEVLTAEEIAARKTGTTPKDASKLGA